jgi:putative ATP-dependent endonuclease of OLD family
MVIERIVVQGYRLLSNFHMEPTSGLNIIVGGNEAGKSTLLEAISLGLTGRLNGRSAQEELNPYWFSRSSVTDFFKTFNPEVPFTPPEILIEIYLSSSGPDLQLLRGVHNSLGQDSSGLSMHIRPAKEYALELDAYMRGDKRPDIIPVEYYEVIWKDFSGAVLQRRPKGIGVSYIDARTIRSAWGVDYHTRELLSGFVEPKERAEISIAHRTARHAISMTALAGVNARIEEQGTRLHDKPLGLQMDQSSNASWETGVVPHVGEVPFALAGQGEQAAIKVALAMSRSAETTSYVLIEEPENHLAHTNLTQLIRRIEDLAGERQVFMTTHSSYVLNRLGIDKLRLMHAGVSSSFANVRAETVNYFKRLSGFDTLRLVLARALILVEGPSDEMLIERMYVDMHGDTPISNGIDVVSMAGVSLARALELAAALKRKAAGVRDNDGKPASHWEAKVAEFLEPSMRALFIGDPLEGWTLEPQILAVNKEATMRTVLGVPVSKSDTLKWMSKHKTDGALSIAESKTRINYPEYLRLAVEFVQ